MWLPWYYKYFIKKFSVRKDDKGREDGQQFENILKIQIAAQIWKRVSEEKQVSFLHYAWSSNTFVWKSANHGAWKWRKVANILKKDMKEQFSCHLKMLTS